MLDDEFARIRAHRNNIHPYRRLLGTRLSDIERQFIERRLAEEETALRALATGRRNAGGRKGGFCGAAKYSVPEIVKSLTPFFLLAAPTAGT